MNESKHYPCGHNIGMGHVRDSAEHKHIANLEAKLAAANQRIAELEELHGMQLAAVMTTPMNIKTEFVNPPIPMRCFDWTAWVDGDEENCHGTGETEEQAIQDLRAKLEQHKEGAD